MQVVKVIENSGDGSSAVITLARAQVTLRQRLEKKVRDVYKW